MTTKGESCEEGEGGCAASKERKRKRKRRDQIDVSIREEGQMGALILGLPQPQEGEEGPKWEGE